MEQRTFNFSDLDDGDEAVVIVRAVSGRVGLALSKREDGDVEVFMPTDVASALADALIDATR